MQEMERDLLGRVDLVIATSEKLFEDKSAIHPRVRLVRHGVDAEAFRDGRGTAPAALATFARPVFGATGLVDARIDAAMVARLASAMPEATFAFIGPRQLPAGPLDRLANVRFLPPVPYADVPATVHAFDVAILPYVETRLTERINPLKLREYLAAGVPVVATPLPEASRFADVIELARTPEEWVAALRRAAAEGRTRSEARRARVAGETWDARAEEFSRHILESEAAVGSAS
jgi:glycosyltransferase involved in cell wall biosynthesis